MTTFIMYQADGSYRQIRPDGAQRFRVTYRARGGGETGRADSFYLAKDILSIVPGVQVEPFEQWLRELSKASLADTLAEAIGSWAQGDVVHTGALLEHALKTVQCAQLANSTLNLIVEFDEERPF